jgi:tetratricopeptide (TPR) repeat protein
LLAGSTIWHARRSDALHDAEVAESKGDDKTALLRALDELDRYPRERGAALVAARSLSRLDFAESAEPYYEQAGGTAPGDLRIRVDGLVRLGLTLLGQARLDEADKVAARLERLSEGVVAGYALEGLVHHAKNESMAAIAAFERVLKQDAGLNTVPIPPDEFWAKMAEDLIEAHRPAEARRYLEKALGTREEHTLMDLLGQVALQEGSLDEAERCWRQSLAWNPYFSKSHLNLGRLALQRDRLAEAVASLERASELAPDSYDAADQLAVAYRRTGREDEARQQSEKAEKLRRQVDWNGKIPGVHQGQPAP